SEHRTAPLWPKFDEMRPIRDARKRPARPRRPVLGDWPGLKTPPCTQPIAGKRQYCSGPGTGLTAFTAKGLGVGLILLEAEPGEAGPQFGADRRLQDQLAA